MVPSYIEETNTNDANQASNIPSNTGPSKWASISDRLRTSIEEKKAVQQINTTEDFAE